MRYHLDVKEEHVSTIFKNQDRLRQNIKSMEKMPSNDLVKRYLADLNSEETDLINTRQEITALNAEIVALKQHIEETWVEIKARVSRLV